MARHTKRRRRRVRRLFCIVLFGMLLVGGGLLWHYRADLLPGETGELPTEVRPATTATTTAATTTTTAKTTTTTAKSTTAVATTTKKTEGSNVISGVPIIAQRPEFPTGCESVSAVIAMQFAGSRLTVGEFVDNYLEMSNDFYTENGVQYGPDPYKIFVGSPRSDSAFGCMAPVIEKAMKRYYRGSKTVVNATGTELTDLCSRYIDKGIPCVVWVTIGMVESYYTSSWTLSNGETYRWLANEHCMVLIGYDENYYYFSDPYRGAQVKYSRWIVNERYTTFGKQALVITD